MNQSLGKTYDIGQNSLYELLFTSFWLVDFLFGNYSFLTRIWQLVLGIF